MTGTNNVVMNAVMERFVERSPLTVMARLALERALQAEWVDALFEAHRQRQYTRELLFSTVIDLMSLVVLGLQPSLHAAAQASEALSVSLPALYDKVKRIEPGVLRALVQGSAERLGPVQAQLRAAVPRWAPGFRVRIVDGNHLPGSEKRLGPLRGFRGAALPGQSLVVYDPDQEQVVDVVPCEDAHSQEKTLMPAILEKAEAGDLWLADRQFGTRSILAALHTREAAFIIRESAAHPQPRVLEPLRQIGRVETGMVSEQAVDIPLPTGERLGLRRIELVLDEPTEDGETLIRLLTNVPCQRLPATSIARLYRGRWRIEGLFQRLEAVLHSEVRTLGYPRAALLAFCVAVVAYNALAVLHAAAETHPAVAAEGIELSPYYVAHAATGAYEGMLVALPPPVWKRFEELPPQELAQTLQAIAAHLEPRRLRKHPRTTKKTKPKPGYAPRAEVQRHVSTARVLRDGGIRPKS